MDAIDHFRIIDKATHGVPKEKQFDGYGATHDQNVKEIYEVLEKHGREKAYMSAHFTYMVCVSNVIKSSKNINTKSEYYHCADRCAARTAILLSIAKEEAISDVYKKFPHEKKVIDVLYRMSEKDSFLYALKFSKDSFETCFQEAQALEK